ncbi:MAG: hypothetical protein HN341_04980 [Verrucomicrobia bacterium]|jgi:hypothetical protein|nr:hypothetical protein [Verrucomicrobiota bacterium]
MMKRTSQHVTRSLTCLSTVAVLVGVLSLSSQAAETGVSVSEELTYSGESAQVSQLADGTVRIKYLPIGLLPEDGAAQVVGAVSALVGDYDLAAAAGMSVNLRPSGGAHAAVKVALKGESTRIWSLACEGVQDAPMGEWITENVSFDKDAGWIWTGNPVADTKARWEADLASVEEITIKVFRASNILVHECRLNSVQLLLAKDVVIPLTVLEARLESAADAAGVASVDDLMGIDTDGDGQTDYEEIMYTQTDHTDASSAMGLNDAEASATGITLSWDCVINGEYTVSRASTPAGPYADLATGLIGAENGSMSYEDDTATDGPYFYRVTKTN